MSQAQSTETGINISNYTSERDAGQVRITKPVANSENYVWMRTTHSVGVVNGIPAVVEGAPELRNINRQSIADVEAQLSAQETDIARLREQLSAMLSDMDAADLA